MLPGTARARRRAPAGAGGDSRLTGRLALAAPARGWSGPGAASARCRSRSRGPLAPQARRFSVAAERDSEAETSESFKVRQCLKFVT